MAQADVKAKAILSAEASAEASLDAKAKVAAQATLRAEAYTVAKIRVDAQAKAQAHLHAAAVAKFKLASAAKLHIRAVIKAALGVSAAAKVGFDGSQKMGDQVKVHTDVQATKDISYVKEVADDYAAQPDVDIHKRADYWNGVVHDLNLQKDATLTVVDEIDYGVSEGLKAVVITQQDLAALGQQYL
jgi:hypothetical protein